jgi:8-oxo-dGTP pyrophosphatase MutT (NUDIX family)
VGADEADGWFRTLDRQVVYDGWSTVRVDQVRMPDGAQAEREVVEHMSAVAVVPVFDDGTVALLRQYRHPVGRYLLEIPAGVLDVDGEAEDDAAQRELAEEMGLRAGRLEHLTTFENSAGWSTERTHVYLGRDLAPTPLPDGFEPEHEEADMEVVRLPLDAAVDGVRRGEVTDAKTVIGLLLAVRDA